MEASEQEDQQGELQLHQTRQDDFPLESAFFKNGKEGVGLKEKVLRRWMHVWAIKAHLGINVGLLGGADVLVAPDTKLN